MIEQPIRTEDRLALHDLVNRYAIFVDTLQLAPLLELFSDDIAFDESAMGPGYGPFKGLNEVQDYFEKVFASVSAIMHITSNHVVDFVDDTHATGISTLLFEGPVPGSAAVRVRGYFHDKYLRTAQGWKFQNRVLKLMSEPREMVQAV